MPAGAIHHLDGSRRVTSLSRLNPTSLTVEVAVRGTEIAHLEAADEIIIQRFTENSLFSNYRLTRGSSMPPLLAFTHTKARRLCQNTHRSLHTLQPLPPTSDAYLPRDWDFRPPPNRARDQPLTTTAQTVAACMHGQRLVKGRLTCNMSERNEGEKLEALEIRTKCQQASVRGKNKSRKQSQLIWREEKGCCTDDGYDVRA
ncbi:unnamed protein product [Protopolystoma xenopodis]|uniref:Uncharacterized protein n=1 Tax=Protopolystoma xenopodis TaxID=117903 RepID=A0A3S5B4K8_9PLAT|nr:unnamed protein product [Protopolystoma xenopodis]